MLGHLSDQRGAREQLAERLVVEPLKVGEKLVEPFAQRPLPAMTPCAGCGPRPPPTRVKGVGPVGAWFPFPFGAAGGVCGWAFVKSTEVSFMSKASATRFSSGCRSMSPACAYGASAFRRAIASERSC